MIRTLPGFKNLNEEPVDELSNHPHRADPHLLKYLDKGRKIGFKKINDHL